MGADSLNKNKAWVYAAYEVYPDTKATLVL